ncbi:MAG: hypothetical protein HeimC3_43570 [Candidatus Heimdallarchaeota archaeon LC_3]|nr:MAG: hypothetical protein HeimC3_43570 [Candidatus Heimdallarchaeota archaeon LC_3]
MRIKIFIVLSLLILLLINFKLVDGKISQELTDFILETENPELRIFDKSVQHEIDFFINITFTDGIIKILYEDWELSASDFLSNGTIIKNYTITKYIDLRMENGTSAIGYYFITIRGRCAFIGCNNVDNDLIFSLLPVLLVLIRKKK